MAVSEGDVLQKLATIPVPDGGRSVVDAGAVQRLSIDGSTVRVVLAVETGRPGQAETYRTEVSRQLETLDGVEAAEVSIQTILPTMQSTPQPGPQAPAQPEGWAHLIPDVKRVIAVASGKGGVGKSTVAANLALALAGADQVVGLLDADIYGPSQQLMMGSDETPMGDQSGKIHPVDAPGGVKVMSFGYIIDPDQPVIWRGPMLQKALEQFVGDVLWGELDQLVVDLPPGTGDVALTLCQNVPLAGAVIVSTPQDVALIDARKSLHMFRKLDVPVLGIVENMAHYRCPECGHVEHVFGAGGGRRTAESLGIPLLGEIPIDPAISAGGDHGKPVVLERPDSPAAKAFVALAAAILDATSS
jgi:ATP-binding protein involved in chromosome partitioning